MNYDRIEGRQGTLYLILGGALVGLAVVARSQWSWLLGAGGGYLLYTGWSRRDRTDLWSHSEGLLDPVNEASEESFPASDPPSWTMGPGS